MHERGGARGRFEERADRAIAEGAQHREEGFASAGGEEGGGVRDDVGVLVLVGGEQEAEGEAAGVGVGVCVGDVLVIEVSWLVV